MSDHNFYFNLSKKDKLPTELKEFLNKTRDDLKGDKGRAGVRMGPLCNSKGNKRA